MSIAGDQTYITLDANDLKAGDLMLLEGQPSPFQVSIVKNSKEGSIVQNPGVLNDQDWEHFSPFINNDSGMYVAESVANIGSNIRFTDGAEISASSPEPFKEIRMTPEILFPAVLDTYFSNFTRAIRTPTIIRAWLNISVLELLALDQTRPIYINSLAQNFYINKIEQFKAQGLVRFELLKV